MPHPLAGAYARIDRADRHFEELKSLIEGFRKKAEDQFVAQHDPKTLDIITASLKQTARLHSALGPLSVIQSAVVVSDIIHNLRAALDYLVYELAILDDKGREHKGTQFIIEDSKADTKQKSGRIKYGFDSRSKRCLSGLSIDHVRAVELLQPYSGVTWTKTLRDISNPDKHRKLTAISGQWEGSHAIEGGPPGSFEGRIGKVRRGVGKYGADVYTEGQYTIQVQLPDGTPVLETLEILKRKVRATIDAFKPEFK